MQSGGGDRVRYAVDVSGAQGPYRLEAELRYQSIAFRWAANLRQYDSAETQRFVRYYDASSAGAVATLVLRHSRHLPLREEALALLVGAGVVGLASALALTRLQPDLKLIILEKEGRVAAHQTGNNSGVIHAGLYYKPGSLKAKMAVEGARCMIEFCQEHDLPHELCGKVVVATSEAEVPRLDELYRRGVANGVPGLVRLSAGEIADYEPHARGVAGLWSPRTGIVDYLAVTAKYAELVQGAGATIRFNTEVTGIQERDGGGDEATGDRVQRLDHHVLGILDLVADRGDHDRRHRIADTPGRLRVHDSGNHASCLLDRVCLVPA